MHYTEIENLFFYRQALDMPKGFELVFRNGGIMGHVVHTTPHEDDAQLWVQTSIDAVNMVLNAPGLISGDDHDVALKTYIEGHPDFGPDVSVYQLALRLIRERDAIDNILKIRR